MATEIPGRKITRIAGADLKALQHYYVKLDTDGTVIAMTANTEMPYGILQNKPDAGEEAEIMRSGVSKLVCGAVVAIGNVIGAGATGKGMPYVYTGADVDKFITGVALAATGADGDVFTVDFSCEAPHRGV